MPHANIHTVVPMNINSTENENDDGVLTESETSLKLISIRNKLKLLIHNAHLELDHIQDMQNKFEEWIRQKLIDTSFYSTLCQKCNEACHENCNSDEITIIGDQIIEQCWVIKNGHCNQCVGKCHISDHYYAKKTIKQSKKSIKELLKDITTKYTLKSPEKTILTKEDAICILDDALEQNTREILQLCMKLNYISAEFDQNQEPNIPIVQLKFIESMLSCIEEKRQFDKLYGNLTDLLNRMTNDFNSSAKNQRCESAEQLKQDNKNGNDEKDNTNISKTEFFYRLNILDHNEMREFFIDVLLVNQTVHCGRLSSETEETRAQLRPVWNQLKVLLHSIRVEMELILCIQDQINLCEIQMNDSDISFGTYEDLMKSYVIDVITIINTSSYSTLCQKCNEACHENCKSDEMTIIGDQIIEQCWVIKNGHCRQCVGKCPYSEHYYAKKTIKQSKKSIQELLKDITIKCTLKSPEKTILTKEDAICILDDALEQNTKEILQLCLKLKYMCADFDLSEELNVFTDQINNIPATLKSTQTKQKTNILIGNLKDMCAKLYNDGDSFQKGFLSLSIINKQSSDDIIVNMTVTKHMKNIGETNLTMTADNEKVQDSFANESTSESNLSSTSEKYSMKDAQEVTDISDIGKVLIIGETGSGKSTFINYLTNYFYNGTLKNLRVAIPSKFHLTVTENFSHCENDLQNTMHSKTDDCHQYLFSVGSKRYLFIDTPGLSDTRGTQQDDKNITKIINAVENLGGLNAVMIVVNGAVSRLTINLRHVLSQLRGNLPDIIMNNVIVVLTNATRYTVNFNLDALELSGNVYPYYMQNSAFSQDPSYWTPVAFKAIQSEFDTSMIVIKNMINIIDTFQTKSVQAFKMMKNIRNEIKTLLHNVRLEISQIQKLQDEINIWENLAKQCDNDLTIYRDYTREREIDTIELVDVPFNNTLCRQCNHICHENCQLDESTTIGDQIFYQCWAIHNGYCLQCVGHCSYTNHYHARKTIQRGKKKIQDVLHDIKTKYEQTLTEKNFHEKRIISKEDAKNLLENALKQETEDITQLCSKLNQFCTRFDLAQELYVLIHQIETEGSMLRNIEAKKQSIELTRTLNDLCQRIANNPDRSKKLLSKMTIVDTADNSNTTELSNNHSTNSASKSSISTSALPSEPSCQAEDDVLDVIRSIHTKKAAKQLKNKETKTKIASETYKNRDDIEDKINLQTQHESSIKEKTFVVQSTILNNVDLKTLSVIELIDYYNSRKDDSQANIITIELTQRAQGKSIGPLKTPEAMAKLTTSIRKYSTLGKEELIEEYDNLQSCINTIIGSDILKLHQIPSHILINISIVYQQLQRESFIDDEGNMQNSIA
ncbi:hypothetical protein I4U23_003542 [Adineta vaga]|nr:hypothetical protein I4U23_003542 [Adineta vaga]